MRLLVALVLLTGCVTPADKCRREHPNFAGAMLQNCIVREAAARQEVSRDLKRVSDDMRESADRADQEQRLRTLENAQQDQEYRARYGLP